MIDKQYGEIVFECDGCPETLPTAEDIWSDAMAQFRQNGWLAEKVGEEWTHLCPDCRRRSK